ncbi:hypothetical protein BC332_25795 [Capsicum chinense]|nr:hypothetical protein BC332_25795 [Capsicum chinense]
MDNIKEWKELIDSTKLKANEVDVKSNSTVISQHSVPREPIWEKFDITTVNNACFKLDYIKTYKAREITMVEIHDDDIKSETNYWKHSIICYVLGAYSPFSVLNRYVQRKYGKLGINKVSMMKNGAFIVRLDNTEGKEEVLQGGIYYFDNEPLIVKG